MAIEILDYRYSTEWNLKEFLTDETFKQNLQEKFPFVTSTVSSFTSDALQTIWVDYLQGKRRGKPSELRNSQNDSVVSFAGTLLGISGPSFRLEAACSSSLYAFYVAGLISQDTQSPVVKIGRAHV